jgi:hypothetical protein
MCKGAVVIVNTPILGNNPQNTITNKERTADEDIPMVDTTVAPTATLPHVP